MITYNNKVITYNSKAIIHNKSEVLFEMQITVPSNNYTLNNFQIVGNANKILNIDWGDSTETIHIFNGTIPQSISKTYLASGVYNVKITGDLNNWTWIYNFDFNCFFDVKYLPKQLLRVYGIYDNATVTGNINTLPPLLNTIRVFGLNTLTGNVKDFSDNMINVYITGENTLTGDIKDIRSSITLFICTAQNTLTGDIGDLKSTLKYFSVAGLNTINKYTSKNWSGISIQYFRLIQKTGYGLSSDDCAQLIIDISQANWIVEKLLTLPSPNATPTPSQALTDALALLASKGVTVTTA